MKDFKEKMENLYTGCYCGLHGFIVLPDCDTEEHGEKCARCLLKTLN